MTARKPRVRDHAAEYARLKARAQAAGLSTRGFRRARKQNPDRYYSPRAQVTLETRRRKAYAKRALTEDAVDAIVSITSLRASSHHTTDDLITSAEKHIAHASDDDLKRFLKAYDEWTSNLDVNIDGHMADLHKGRGFWADDDLFFLLYYKD